MDPLPPIIKRDVTIWSKIRREQRLLQNQENHRYTLDHDKIVVSKSIPCNEGKDQCYTVRYEDGDEIVPLYIKTPPKVFSYGVSQYSKNSAWKMGFNLKDHEEWVNDYRKIWKAVEEQLFVTFTSEPLKEGCYLNAKLNVYKDKIRTDFHGKISRIISIAKQLQYLKLNRCTNKVVITTLRCMWKRQRSSQLRNVDS